MTGVNCKLVRLVGTRLHSAHRGDSPCPPRCTRHFASNRTPPPPLASQPALAQRTLRPWIRVSHTGGDDGGRVRPGAAAAEFHRSSIAAMSAPQTTTTSGVLRAVGIATAALAALTLGRTIWQMEDAAKERKKYSPSAAAAAAASCCSSSSSSSSASAFVTAGSDPASNPYETRVSVYEYLLMHFGGEAELLNFPDLQGEQMKHATSFPLQCAQICAKFVSTVPAFVEAGSANLRALDIGCSVGRSSFEMTRDFGTVIGLDYSNAFIEAANQLKKVRPLAGSHNAARERERESKREKEQSACIAVLPTTPRSLFSLSPVAPAVVVRFVQDGEMAYEMRTEGDLKQQAVARVDPQLVRNQNEATKRTSECGAKLHGTGC